MKMLKMNVLLGDMKTSQFFTKEHIKVLHVINAHVRVRMRMMTTRGAIMLMMLMMKMTMMQRHVKITVAYTHARWRRS